MDHREINLNKGIERFDIDAREEDGDNDEPSDEGANEEDNVNPKLKEEAVNFAPPRVHKHLTKSERVMVGAPSLSIRKARLQLQVIHLTFSMLNNQWKLLRKKHLRNSRRLVQG